MKPADIIAEWRRCGDLRKADIERLTGAGVDIMSLAMGPDWSGFALARDRVVVHPDGQRFEFERHSRTEWDSAGAYIVVAHDREGDVCDLVAWRPEKFLASWLGRAALLGAENIEAPRIVEAGLRVHETPLGWLQAGRDGVVVVDPKRAGPDLRFAEPLVVSTTTWAAKLRDILRVRTPRIVVDRDAREDRGLHKQPSIAREDEERAA